MQFDYQLMDVRQKLANLPGVDSTIQQNVSTWLQEGYDIKTRQAIEEMIEHDPHELIDAFYTNLSFGTAGLRGIMGPGTNRMNEYTVRAATQGLANYLRQVFGSTHIRVAIGYDSRHHSQEFAMEAARVLAGNKIEACIFEELRPTPLVSFACRHKKCQAAIMITASHNPPNYNGYKVYWDDGGQVVAPHDIGIINEVKKITHVAQVVVGPANDPLITYMGKEVDDAYLQAINLLQLYPEKRGASELKILYSNLHGTGITIVPRALERFGFSSLYYVLEQKEPDGDFPTTKAPNPEEPAALALGMQQLLNNAYDIFIATDPDCDRMGVVVRHNNKAVRLTGNQIAAIFAYGICHALTLQKRMPPKPAFVKSLVTTDLLESIVKGFGAHCFDVLTGFKYIAQKIRQWESGQGAENYDFVFGCEESYGYLRGSYARDKDAAEASCLISEIALQAKQKGKTLVDLLDDIYAEYGYFSDHLFTLVFEESKAGKEAMQNVMKQLRSQPPHTIDRFQVTKMLDFQSVECIDFKTNKRDKIDYPKADMVIFELGSMGKVVCRPSGTEPKMKIYIMLHGEKPEGTKLDLERQIKEAENTAQTIYSSLPLANK